MNFDNGHRARQGQHNKRGRGRNNRRPGGGGGSSHNAGGGNSANRVYESNGPDVKVRGTAQTVAEKYMQLGRDAQSSGDNVMAESYFQFSEHYFRVMAAAQPVGQPTTQLRRPEDEDFEEDGGDAAEGETETAQAAMVSEGGQAASGEQADRRRSKLAATASATTATATGSVSAPAGRTGATSRAMATTNRAPPRLNRKWPRKSSHAGRPNGNVQEADSGQWEAPSFLRRPAPVEVVEEPVAEKKGRAPRRARAASAADEE